MEYPKPMMSLKELKDMGLPREYLLRAVHCQYAHKFIDRSGSAANSKFLIDTAEFEKLRKKGVFR